MAEYDLLIKNGTIIDGLRIPRYRGDVAIRAGKIVAIGNIQGSLVIQTNSIEFYFIAKEKSHCVQVAELGSNHQRSVFVMRPM